MKTRNITLLLAAAAPSALFSSTDSPIPFAEAVFTEVVNDVQVVQSADASVRKAEKNARFLAPDLVKTGRKSRAQLTSADGTVARIGSNAVFSFDKDSRTMNLQKGSVLFHSPTGKGGGTIVTNSATASVVGTTIMVSATADGGFKLFVLEGVAKMTLNGKAVSLAAGQMTFVRPVASGGASEPGPVLTFDLAAMTGGSQLVSGFEGDLASQSKILDAMKSQGVAIEDGDLKRTGLFILDSAQGDSVAVTTFDEVLNAVSQNGAVSRPTDAQRLATALNETFTFSGGVVPETYVFRTPVALPAGTLPQGVVLPGDGQLTGILAGTVVLDNSTLNLGFLDGLQEIDVVGLAANTLKLNGNVVVNGLSATRSLNLGGQNVVIAPNTTVTVEFAAGSPAVARLFSVNDLSAGSLSANVINGGLTGETLLGALSLDSSSISSDGALLLRANKSASFTGTTTLTSRAGDVSVVATGVSGAAGLSISAAGAISLNAGTGALSLAKPDLVAGRDVTLVGGTMTFSGQGGSQSGNTVTLGGKVDAGTGLLTISGGSFSADGFTQLSGAVATVALNGALSLTDAAIHADSGAADITAASATLTNSEIKGATGIRLIATTGPVTLASGVSLDAGSGNLSVQSGAGITSDSTSNLMSSGTISLNAGSGALSVDGSSFSTADLILSGASVNTRFSGATLPAGLRVTAMAGDAVLTGMGAVNSSGLFLSATGGALSLDATSLNSLGAITLQGDSLVFTSAAPVPVNAQGALNILSRAAALTFSSPNLQGATVDVSAGGLLSLSGIGGTTYGDGGRVQSTSGLLRLGGVGLTSDGFVDIAGASGADLSANSAALTLSDTRISTLAGDITLSGATVSLGSGLVLAAASGLVTVDASAGATLTGLDSANTNLTVHAGTGSADFSNTTNLAGMTIDGAGIRIGDANTLATITTSGTITLTTTGSGAGSGISLMTGGLIDGTTALTAGGDIVMSSASDLSASNVSLTGQNLTFNGASGVTLNGASVTVNGSQASVTSSSGLVAMNGTTFTYGARVIGFAQAQVTQLPPAGTTGLLISGPGVSAMNLSVSGFQQLTLTATAGDIVLDGHSSLSTTSGPMSLSATAGSVLINGDGTVNGGAGSGGTLSASGLMTVSAKAVSLSNYVSLNASSIDIALTSAAVTEVSSFNDSSISTYAGDLYVRRAGGVPAPISFGNMSVTAFGNLALENSTVAGATLTVTGGSLSSTGTLSDVRLAAYDTTLDGVTVNATGKFLDTSAHGFTIASAAGSSSVTADSIAITGGWTAPGVGTPASDLHITGDSLNNVWVNLDATSTVIDQTNILLVADTVTLDAVAFGSSANVGNISFTGGYGSAVTIRVASGKSNLLDEVPGITVGRANFLNGTGFNDDGVLAVTSNNYAWVPAENIGDVEMPLHVLDFTTADFRGTKFAYSKQANLTVDGSGTAGLSFLPNSHRVISLIDPAPTVPQADILSAADFGVTAGTDLGQVDGHNFLNVRGVLAKHLTIAGDFDFGPGLQSGGYDTPPQPFLGDNQDHVDIVTPGTLTWNAKLSLGGFATIRKVEIKAGDITGTGAGWGDSIAVDTANAGDAALLTVAAAKSVSLTGATLHNTAGSVNLSAITGDITLSGASLSAGGVAPDLQQTPVSVSGNLRLTAAGTITVSGASSLRSEIAGVSITAPTVVLTGTPGQSDLTVAAMNGTANSPAGFIEIRSSVKVTVKDGQLRATSVAIGAPINSGSSLDEIEMEKVTFDLPSFNTGIAMEAKTIGIKDVAFPDSAQVRLKSKDGVLNLGSKMFGAVNFISNVTHGGVDITTKAGIDQKVWIENHATAPSIYINGVLDTTGINGTGNAFAAPVHIQSIGATNQSGPRDPAS